MYLLRDNRMFYALLIAIAIQSVGVYALIGSGLVEYTAGSWAWFATIIGSFVFGIGIVLAGGCATGTWYRAGEGLVGSWIALVGYMAGAAMMKSGPLQPVSASLKTATVPQNSMAATFGVSVWFFVGLLAVITVFFAARTLRRERGIVVPALKPKRTGLAHLLFEKRWHPFFTAVLIGLIAIAAWPLSELTGRMAGLGITGPSSNLLTFLVTGDIALIDWGVYLVLGIFAGSFIAALGAREFKLRSPDAKTAVMSACGGLCMGFGASLAGGCSIGNGLVNTAMMTWQGWVALLFMILGVWFTSYFVYVRARRRSNAVQPATQSI
jgi:uncharacterized membrane protein YedE/YeeE